MSFRGYKSRDKEKSHFSEDQEWIFTLKYFRCFFKILLLLNAHFLPLLSVNTFRKSKNT